MKTILQHLRDRRPDLVAAEFENMKRLWPDSQGLRGRRDKEAEMWRRGLTELT
jgi:hypothetical protein